MLYLHLFELKLHDRNKYVRKSAQLMYILMFQKFLVHRGEELFPANILKRG